MGDLVSIIVPVYNTEKYIEKCIKSILEQTYKNIELILVDDGSKQKEEAIIKKYMGYDRRICYIKNQTNRGLFSTRISGVKHAAGKYLMFVDSDDYISFDYVRLLVEEAKKEDADIVFSTTILNTPKEKKVINTFQDTALYQLPLSGEKARKAFFEQGGTAYVWHTIWNKLYKKELWDCCLPFFEKLDKHVVMTEDIAFSCVLFYFTKRVARAENSVYFYCQHPEASTSSSHLYFSEYKKKVTDISAVFGFLEDFFKDKEKWYQDRLLEFKQYYARIWKRGIVNIIDGNQEEAERLIINFCENSGEGTVSEDGYFNQAQAPYSDRLDEIKKQIWFADKKYVSFDIFDTVITRPFFTPSDLFYLLDDIYDEDRSNTSFHTIRVEGEEGCRRKLCGGQKEDVTIDEIYAYISENYGISKELCLRIKQREEDLEISFSRSRKAAHEIYDVALLSGKKVVFISDMYLKKETIEKILVKNGYHGQEEIFVSSEYGKLKSTGGLFWQAAQTLQADLRDFIHIGDNLVSDVETSKSLGVTAIYFPKACDVFEGRKGFEKISGYGCMIAMVANRYFDNPFRYFHPMTDLNMDAFLAGYYVLGMKLAAQIQLTEQMRKAAGLERIIFTEEDGYLTKWAYDCYLKISGVDVKTEFKDNFTSMMRLVSNRLEWMKKYFFVNIENISILKSKKRNYVDKFPVMIMQKAAIDFVTDFYEMFYKRLSYLDIRINDIQMPFENFLYAPSRMDTKIFMGSYFETEICGTFEKLNVRDFWLQSLSHQPGCKGIDIVNFLEDSLKEKGKEKLAFFGTGRICRELLDKNPSIPVFLFLDNNEDKNGKKWYGRTILSPAHITNLKTFYIVIVCAAYLDIEEQLDGMGLIKFDDYINYMEIF